MKLNRILCIPVSLMLLLAVTAVPTMACKPGSECIGLQKISGKPSIGSPVELIGADKVNAVNDAMANSKVKELKDEFTKEGNTLVDIKSYKVPVIYEDGTLIDIQLTTLQFKSLDGNISSINYAYSLETGESVVTVSPAGIISCAVCPAAILVGGIGCASVCIVSGVLTMGVLCAACIVAAGLLALCPCYDCCYSTIGYQPCKDTAQSLGC